MPLFEAEGVVAFLLFALWIYCIFDVISTDSSLCRNLPKMLWLAIVFFIPDIGSICWLILGRPERTAWRPGDTRPRAQPTRRPRTPDDDDDFLSGLSPIVRAREEQAEQRMRAEQLRRKEEELRRREEELRRREGGHDGPADGSTP